MFILWYEQRVRQPPDILIESPLQTMVKYYNG